LSPWSYRGISSHISTRRRGANTTLNTTHTQMGRPTHEAPTRESTHKQTQNTNKHTARPDKVRCGLAPWRLSGGSAPERCRCRARPKAQRDDPIPPNTPVSRVLDRSIYVLAGYHPSRRSVGTTHDRAQIRTKHARTSPESISGSRLPRRGAQGGVGLPTTGGPPAGDLVAASKMPKSASGGFRTNWRRPRRSGGSPRLT
jgi:hypothetical protein